MKAKVKKQEKLPPSWDSWRNIDPKDPTALTHLIEAGLKLEAQISTLRREADGIDKGLSELKKFILDNFEKSQLTRVETASGVARLVRKTVPVMDPENGGWEAIFGYVKKHNAFDILYKRLVEKACAARWDAREEIPGVKQFHKVEVKFGEAD